VSNDGESFDSVYLQIILYDLLVLVRTWYFLSLMQEQNPSGVKPQAKLTKQDRQTKIVQ
jgi:hypothetical protein